MNFVERNFHLKIVKLINNWANEIEDKEARSAFVYLGFKFLMPNFHSPKFTDDEKVCIKKNSKLRQKLKKLKKQYYYDIEQCTLNLE